MSESNSYLSKLALQKSEILNLDANLTQLHLKIFAGSGQQTMVSDVTILQMQCQLVLQYTVM